MGNVIKKLGIKYKRPPLKIFGRVLWCEHNYADYWKNSEDDPSTQYCVKKCKRCLKEKTQ